MKFFISTLNVPIGYKRPKFPSLYWPVGPTNAKYEESFLYYSKDIWEFTVYWTLILFASLYLVVSVFATCSQIVDRYRHGEKLIRYMLIWNVFCIAFYTLIGLVEGFLCGSVVALLLQAIYRAGSLSMSTWIPFCWAIAMILFNIAVSYHNSSYLL